MQNSTNFESYDTWILVALFIATTNKPQALLEEIIAAADFVNHLIISRDELEMGFSRLVPHGHVICTDDGYRPSAALQAFWFDNKNGNASIFDKWQNLYSLIGASKQPSLNKIEAASTRFVGKEAYDKALRSYQKRY